MTNLQQASLTSLSSILPPQPFKLEMALENPHHPKNHHLPLSCLSWMPPHKGTPPKNKNPSLLILIIALILALRKLTTDNTGSASWRQLCWYRWCYKQQQPWQYPTYSSELQRCLSRVSNAYHTHTHTLSLSFHHSRTSQHSTFSSVSTILK